MRKAISFRLRKIDDDLACAIENMGSEELSNLCRDGLRYMLGLNTTKQIVVEEKPLVRNVQPSPTHNQVMPSTKPSVFRPNNR